MSKEILVVLPHSLGREEARRRVGEAIERARGGIGQGLINADVKWPNPDHADLSVGALGQTVSAQIDVQEAEVRVRVLLPWLLASLAGKVTERIQQAGATLQIGHDPKGQGGAGKPGA